MAGSMEQACARARVLLWRWLGKRCHMSYHYSAIAQFLEHFDCPSYTWRPSILNGLWKFRMSVLQWHTEICKDGRLIVLYFGFSQRHWWGFRSSGMRHRVTDVSKRSSAVQMLFHNRRRRKHRPLNSKTPSFELQNTLLWTPKHRPLNSKTPSFELQNTVLWTPKHRPLNSKNHPFKNTASPAWRFES